MKISLLLKPIVYINLMCTIFSYGVKKLWIVWYIQMQTSMISYGFILLNKINWIKIYFYWIKKRRFKPAEELNVINHPTPVGINKQYK